MRNDYMWTDWLEKKVMAMDENTADKWEKKERIDEEKEIKNPGWLDGRSWLASRCFGRKSRNQRAEKSITKEKKFLNQRRKCGVIVLAHGSLDDPNGMESE